MHEERAIKVCKILENGGIAIVPTDTVYGIVCSASNDDAISKIYSIKKRNSQKPFALLLPSLDYALQMNPILQFASINKLIDILLTGSTCVLRFKKHNLNEISNMIGVDKKNDVLIGVRVVLSGFTARILDIYKKPIVATSANISGSASDLH